MDKTSCQGKLIPRAQPCITQGFMNTHMLQAKSLQRPAKEQSRVTSCHLAGSVTEAGAPGEAQVMGAAQIPTEWKQCQTREIKPHSLQPDVLDAGPLNSDKPRTSHSQTTHVPCVAGSHA